MSERWRWAWVLLIPLAMLGWVAFGNIREDRAALNGGYRELHGAASKAEEGALADLLTEARAVLASPQFDANLRALSGRYRAVYLDPRRQEASVAEVADLLAMKRLGARYVPVDVFLLDDEALGGGYAAATSENSAGEGRYSDIVLGRFLLDAYRAPDVVVRSCAVNVAAHEYSHTLSRTPFLYRPAFTDTSGSQTQIPGRRDRSNPVASYLVGSVAQCTWLQLKGRITAGEVPACVEVFGVASGNSQRCDQFGTGEPVVPRPDLPPASPPL
ncbi:hypothetical protein [Phenylobacterium sp.]|uniref:hypothetical protein n=1 Tax=Phenylobacterium sp. TaxID=1871053 RepID=UPI002F92ED0C